MENKKLLIDKDFDKISLNRQLYLLGINKSSYYYKTRSLDNLEDMELLKIVDKIYTKYPTFGTRKMCDYLFNEYQTQISRDKMRLLYNKLRIRAIYQEPRLIQIDKENKVYPYLLNNIEINRVNQVWSTDITYIPLKNGFIYLSAIIDWFSRYILNWSLHIDMEAINCKELLQDTINMFGKCDIFNTDQGSQYTSKIFTDCLINNSIRISMDGRGRWADNVFIERLWRTIKYECVYLNDFNTIGEGRQILKDYFKFYNEKRPHQSLGGRSPKDVYCKMNK